MKVLALDYGRARTGVAVSDPTGIVARPLAVIERVETAAGRARLRELIDAEAPERVVVGLPLTLRGERGAQAVETESFIDVVRELVSVPVESWDERFTTALAGNGDDADAAAHLLTSYLAWLSRPKP